MDNRNLKILEYDKVLDQLSTYAVNQPVKKKIKSLLPLTNKDKIERLHAELDEIIQIIIAIGKAPISPVDNINDLINRARIDSVLLPSELLQVKSFLKNCSDILHYFNELENVSDLELTPKYFESLTDLSTLVRSIDKKIKSDNEIADNASSLLQKIRREKLIKNKKIDTTLNRIINNPNNEKFLQDKLVSIRNGRYVIPVKKEYKSNIPGTIMDRSSSGNTLFIEPLSVLELNNDLNELEIEEQKEIRRILRDLTKQVKDSYEEIKLNYENFLDLDFLYAKANYALDTNAHRVSLNEDSINLRQAKHPLIDPSQVVASNIKIEPNTKTLVITGPNTGGKTVSLKTIGLLTAMNQTGLFIPVKDGSTHRVFQNIYADIGDEQSIEQNLSTFSSHLTNIVNILNDNNGESLILLDEIGAGTDPDEGAALAMSILDSLRNSSNLTIATTHYPEIKEYALVEDNVQNASVEFDVESLKPTFRLIIGIPGRSNAFEIAQRLGLPKNIINQSKKRMDSNQQQLSDSLDRAQDELFKARKEYEKAEQFRIESQKQFEKQKKEFEQTKNKQKRIIEKAKSNAQKIVNETKRQTDFIYREIQSIQNQASKNIDNKRLEKLRVGLKDLENSLDKINQSNTVIKKENLKLEDFKVGDRVLIKSLDQEVNVSNILTREKKIEVSSGTGNIRMRFKPNELIILKSEQPKSEPKVKVQRITKNMDTRLDLRGKSVSEAQPLLENFIADAILLNQDKLEIIHGFGTGQIREMVHNYLRKSKHIKSYRLGGPGEGGGGATIVEL